ncbi:MAG TPA: hypothetical protein QF571_00340 [Desulfobacterales bacterium]|nr:hypothetical protein [Desulfobacterales bacterium]
MKKCNSKVLVALAVVCIFISTPVLGADIELAKKSTIEKLLREVSFASDLNPGVSRLK